MLCWSCRNLNGFVVGIINRVQSNTTSPQSEDVNSTPLGHYDPRRLLQEAASTLHTPQHEHGYRFSSQPTIEAAVSLLSPSVQNHLLSLVSGRVLTSLEALSEKCYEILAQLSEPLANEVIKRFASANLATVRNPSGFFIGVINKCRQEFGFND
jgi:Heterogeneous nuclear ribonucleoprotein Q acidic domain